MGPTTLPKVASVFITLCFLRKISLSDMPRFTFMMMLKLKSTFVWQIIPNSIIQLRLNCKQGFRKLQYFTLPPLDPMES